MPDRQWVIGSATRFAAMLVVAAALLGMRAAAAAEDADSFTVREVHVDVTADNVNVARDQAFAQGQHQAFDTLVKRFTTADEASHLPVLSDAQLDDLVVDVGVDQEKRSTVRYIAVLSVRFKPDAIRHLLHDAGIAYVEWRGKPVVVLPILKTEIGPILWEATNTWRAAWKSGAAQGLVPLAVPAPTPAAQAPDDALQAATAGPETLSTFAARFDTPDLLVATGVIGKTDDGRPSFDVTLAGTGPVAGAVAGTKSWQADAGEALDTLLRRAVADIASAVNDAYKNDNMMPGGGEVSSLSVTAPIAGLADWSKLRERLARVTLVRNWQVGALSQTSVTLVLNFVGQQPQLEAALVQNGLVLSNQDSNWVLQNAVAQPHSAPAGQ